jgi:hypothetical protein
MMDTLSSLLAKLQASTNADATQDCGPVISPQTFELNQLYQMAVYSNQVGDIVYRDKVLTYTFNTYDPA